MADKAPPKAEFQSLESLPVPPSPFRVSTHDAPQHNLGGRPSLFTPELAAEICALLGAGQSLRRICRGENMPHEATVRSWALSDPDGFGKAYREARDLGLDAMADETLDISDDGTNDTQVDGEGNTVTNYDHIQRSRLRVDTRKWYLAKLAPKRYGDSARVEHTGADGGPIRTLAASIDLTQLAAEDRDALRDVLARALALPAAGGGK